MTGPLLLQQIQHSLAAASSWQQAEGALFCLKAAAPALKGGRKAHLESSPHAQQVQQLLQELFEDLCSPTSRTAAFLSSPYTSATAATLVGSYSSLFDTAHLLLEGALRLLLHALCFSYSWHEAAGAFKALCIRCASYLADRQVLQSLAAVAAGTVAPVAPAGQVSLLNSCQLVRQGNSCQLLTPGPQLLASLLQSLFLGCRALVAVGEKVPQQLKKADACFGGSALSADGCVC
jgi:hypothetical protein